MKKVADACTLILLAKASVLETAIDEYKIYTTNEVLTEVLKGKEKMFQDALLVERLHNEKKLVAIKADTKLKAKLMQDFNMGEGEASAIAVCLKAKGIIATDNRQGRKAALINNLALIGSIEVVIGLCKRKKISSAKATSALRKLQEAGWFDSNLISKAQEDIK